MSSARHVFELSGGNLALDFANSVSDRPVEPVEEHIHGYADLVSWGRQAELVSSRGADRLSRGAKGRPRDADRVLGSALVVREAIYRIFSAVAAERRPRSGDLSILNDALPDALARLRLQSTGEGIRWDWRDDDEALDTMLWPVVRSAAELLTSAELALVRECAADECGWLFLDRSRNHSRRWCDMKVCGNRDKVRRHYRRTKGSE